MARVVQQLRHAVLPLVLRARTVDVPLAPRGCVLAVEHHCVAVLEVFRLHWVGPEGGVLLRALLDVRAQFVQSVLGEHELISPCVQVPLDLLEVLRHQRVIKWVQAG